MKTRGIVKKVRFLRLDSSFLILASKTTQSTGKKRRLRNEVGKSTLKRKLSHHQEAAQKDVDENLHL